MSGGLIDDWFAIIGPSGKPPKPNAAIQLQIKFTSCDERNKGDAIDTDEVELHRKKKEKGTNVKWPPLVFRQDVVEPSPPLQPFISSSWQKSWSVAAVE
ncbi:hypothetical protein L1987_15382 [Smallanthus sonchifolius]|uniref:Uncharacterized protein n=1 Tax=Smallanthus sonchifolius TaxID=185202 RepID=A0ACB9J7P3_9ASTR|nr:hypothetical protein L1987_15382 [Smallanthus sonchifolius]